jgi:uncharacterized protein YndB with AHSA1/START domain
MQTVEIRKMVLELSINAPCDRTWQIMIDDLSEWWPRDFLCFPESEKIRFEPWAGGRLYEETPDGRHILWANVNMILPGKAIELVGYMTPTYGGPSITMYRMEVAEAEDGTTRFKLTDTVMGRMDDEQEANMNEGWKFLFETGFKQYVEAKTST